MKITLPTTTPRYELVKAEHESLKNETEQAHQKYKSLLKERDDKIDAILRHYKDQIYNAETDARVWQTQADRAKQKSDYFFASDGETHAALFTEHTQIALNKPFMFGNGKEPCIAKYNAETNYFSIYKQGAKGRLIEQTHAFANMRNSGNQHVIRTLADVFKRCHKIK